MTMTMLTFPARSPNKESWRSGRVSRQDGQVSTELGPAACALQLFPFLPRRCLQ